MGQYHLYTRWKKSEDYQCRAHREPEPLPLTTPENAASIISTGVMYGNKFEGAHIFAWRMKPIKNSGAHYGVIISFKTNATFMTDSGITNSKVQKYGPVVSVMPGPIAVWDVQIVG